MNSSHAYNKLYDWQRMFVDESPREFYWRMVNSNSISTTLDAKDWSNESFTISNPSMNRIGYFLRMGIGKTLITLAKAEKQNADCIFVTSLKSKVEAGEIEGEFGYELKQSGYKVYYAHKALDEDGNMTILSLDSKRKQREFEQVVQSKAKIAYVFNHEHISTKKGYQRLVYLASNYTNIAWIVDEAHKISNRSAQVSKLMDKMLYSYSTPNVKIPIREARQQIATAIADNDTQRAKQLENLIHLSKHNVFRSNIKGLYLATGTPNVAGYESLYFLMHLLGHEWVYSGQVQDKNKLGFRIQESYTEKTIRGFSAFFEEFCIEDSYAKRFNPFGSPIKDYKNIDKLLDLSQQYSFYARTENYYPDLPPRLSTILWVPKHKTYDQMSDSKPTNPHYRVLDGFICDMPSLLKLRQRQLASGFMGNAEESTYYHTLKVDILAELLNDQPDNYLVFYNYTPELYLILSAAESAGYKVDIWNGTTKSQANYRKAGDTTKNLFIANIDSGSAALNLQKYSKVIFFSLPDTYTDYDQAIGRVQRIGQKSKEVDVIHIIAKGTVEEKVWKHLQIGEDYSDLMYERDIVWREI